MTIGSALLTFCAAAGLLTITPGLDTVLVLRSRLSGGTAAGLAAAVGVGLGCLVWGSLVAVGLGAVLAAMPRAYAALRWCGAAYLFVCGVQLVFKPRKTFDVGVSGPRRTGPAQDLVRGLLTNVLNPKVGLFYLSFLPQFIPDGYAPGPFMLTLTALHIAMGLVWFTVLCLGVGVVRRVVQRPSVLPWLDRLTGGVFVAFGLRLALDRA